MNRKLLVPSILMLYFFFAFLLANTAFGQQQQGFGQFFRFQKVIGTPASVVDDLSGIKRTPDGGYVAVGRTIGGPAAGTDMLLLRLNENGRVRYRRLFDALDGAEEAEDVDVDPNGNFILAGLTQSLTVPFTDGYLVLFDDANQNVLFANRYGTTTHFEMFNAVKALPDGYIAVGSARDGSGNTNIYVVRTDLAGNQMFGFIYGGDGDEIATGVDTTAFGGFVITGQTNSIIPNNNDLFLMAIDGNGFPLLTNVFLTSGFESGGDVQLTADNGYALIGSSNSFSAGGDSDMFMIKTNIAGNVQFARTFGFQTFGDDGLAIEQLPNGGYALAGSGVPNNSPGVGEEMLLVTTDANGDLDFARSYGGNGQDRALAMDATPENQGFILAGLTSAFQLSGSSVPNGYIVKTNDAGFSGCNEAAVTPIQQDPTLTVFSLLSPFAAHGDGIQLGAADTEPNLLQDTPCFEEFTAPINKSGMYSSTALPASAGLELWPNPAMDRVTVRNPFETPAEIVVLDLQGKVLRQMGSTRAEVVLDVRGLPKGVYMVRISDGKERRSGKLMLR